MCSTIKGHTQAQVVDMMLIQVEAMLLNVQSWDPLAPDSDAPEAMSGQMLAVLLLSPNNSHLSGLCAANWEVVTVEDDNGSCRCILLKEQQAESNGQTTPTNQPAPEVKGPTNKKQYFSLNITRNAHNNTPCST
jgi:hypothetical protein